MRCHHERWDASGYPAKLGTSDIPRSARILAVADVVDALHSDRAYRAGLPRETVCEIVRAGRAARLNEMAIIMAGRKWTAQDRVLRASPAGDRGGTEHRDLRRDRRRHAASEHAGR